MKFLYLSGAVVLILSVRFNFWLYQRNETISAERDAVYSELLQTMRGNDDTAQIKVDMARSYASKLAQEKRDALKGVTDTDSVFSVLERCRRGLFGKDAASADFSCLTPAIVDDTPSKAGDTSRSQSR